MHRSRLLTRASKVARGFCSPRGKLNDLFKLTLGLLLTGLVSVPTYAQQSNEDLAKAAQNPLASLISVPFQLNTAPGRRRRRRTC